MTFSRSVRRFGLPTGYIGTSMAAPHVSATAALIVASGVIGANPSPAAARATASRRPPRDLGKPGVDPRYGAGLINAGRATTPASVTPAEPPAFARSSG